MALASKSTHQEDINGGLGLKRPKLRSVKPRLNSTLKCVLWIGLCTMGLFSSVIALMQLASELLHPRGTINEGQTAAKSATSIDVIPTPGILSILPFFIRIACYFYWMCASTAISGIGLLCSLRALVGIRSNSSDLDPLTFAGIPLLRNNDEDTLSDV